MPYRFLRRLGLALGLMVAAAVPVQAQSDFEEAKLDSFVTAAIAVNDLVETWSPRIQNAGSDEEANQLRAQANAEMVTAIENTDGISVDEYREIVQAARGDSALSAQIQEMFQERAGQ